MKKVVVDLTKLGRLCGFGQLCDHYAEELSRLRLPDMHFIFLVRPGYEGRFGDGVDYFAAKKYHKFFPFLLPKADLWHATDQQFRYRRLGRGIRQLLTMHDLNFLYEKTPLKIKKYLWKTQRMVDESDTVVCISHYTAEEVRRHIRLYGRSLEVIPNGVEDVSGVAQERPAFATPDVPFFFAIGQVRSKKNFHLLVDMMRYFPDHHLYICGDDHFSYADTVRNHIAANPARNAFLCGKISQGEKAWLYAHCRAFLFASQLEGFGLPAIEAMQFGRPVFAAPYGSLPEVCGDHACYFPHTMQPEGMAATVREGLAAFERRHDAAAAQRAYAQTFGYARYTKAYVTLYHHMLELPPPRIINTIIILLKNIELAVQFKKDEEVQILVSVLCTAYNHAPYLRQCLEGILAQQTDFRYELILHEDASTDGTRAIVEEYAARYPGIVRALIQEENQYTRFDGDIYRPILFPASRGKYIAVCEGDDYWTDPLKLQKQVDVLEAEPDCGLVCTSWQSYRQIDGRTWTVQLPAREGWLHDAVVSGTLPVGTLTAVFRKSLLAGMPAFDAATHHCGDRLWFTYLSAVSRTHVLPEVTATYRVLPESACHHTDVRRHIRFMYKVANTVLDLLDRYPLRDRRRHRRLYKKWQLAVGKEALASGNIRLMPGRPIAFFPLITLKKTCYTLLFRCVTAPESFARLSVYYNKYLINKE